MLTVSQEIAELQQTHVKLFVRWSEVVKLHAPPKIIRLKAHGRSYNCVIAQSADVLS